MKQEDKKLLLADLCARLPYGVICDRLGKHYPLVDIDIKRGLIYLLRDDYYVPYSILRGDIIKPYLRKLSSMTEEENEEYTKRNLFGTHWDFVDWCNKKGFDYRGLIEKGLAIELTEENLSI